MTLELPLPKLEDFGISKISGFLPQDFPATRLADVYYSCWEDVVGNLPSLIVSRRLRVVVDRIPKLKVKPELVADIRQLRRAYTVLCFIVNAYVWGADEVVDTLPDNIADPILVVSDELGLPPLATYSSLVLWNFRPIFTNTDLLEDGELMSVSNLTSINTFTGGFDETWFYLVSVLFEKLGSKCVTCGLDILQGIRNNDLPRITSSLESLAQLIENLGSLLGRMDEMCDPHIFYYRIRPYLAGWRGMKTAGLPNGLRYGSKGEYKIFAGGSNAQSSLLQVLDILLGVEHFQTGMKASADRYGSAKSESNSYINDMRNYMPREHRDFLHHLSRVSNVRDFVLNRKSNSSLVLAYDACIASLKSFRDKHIQIVTRFILLPSRKAPHVQTAGRSTLRVGLAKSSSNIDQVGTGGTSIIPFLKQCRDETGSVAASDWGKRVVSSGISNLRNCPNTNKKCALSDSKEEEMQDAFGGRG
ncbi:dioxygenase BNA2 Ecym_4655 [Eremothecium cymbalariae DBVPG|uniref:Indoleamine 2,3-dioxygenase n=1 Tax=Eremothecium cymbalariae (strain CBS 270.75 / DBVPG 7215 / KCTC 17166 / NRRL Y-17582) TaxID=931890 RepID=G8JSF5_ERECY|nr:hypothetical protein Ecym_4655 [Eremothecium cymbalariae DBVPG\